MHWDKTEFKIANKRSWEKNTEYWLHNPLRQVQDTQEFFKAKLRKVIAPGSTIVDMGCGSGWLLEFIQELQIQFRYIGMDFNEGFISHLNGRHAHTADVTFDLIDIEEELPAHYAGTADVVFNCFNFLETADLEMAFGNAVKMLAPRGTLVIVTIQYFYLLLARCHSMEELRDQLRQYDEMKAAGEVIHFFQNIDLGNAVSSELRYASVLYSLDDFYQQARRRGLNLIDYGEVVKTAKLLPKVYQYIVFQRGE